MAPSMVSGAATAPPPAVPSSNPSHRKTQSHSSRAFFRKRSHPDLLETARATSASSSEANADNTQQQNRQRRRHNGIDHSRNSDNDAIRPISFVPPPPPHPPLGAVPVPSVASVEPPPPPPPPTPTPTPAPPVHHHRPLSPLRRGAAAQQDDAAAVAGGTGMPPTTSGVSTASRNRHRMRTIRRKLNPRSHRARWRYRLEPPPPPPVSSGRGKRKTKKEKQQQTTTMSENGEGEEETGAGRWSDHEDHDGAAAVDSFFGTEDGALLDGGVGGGGHRARKGSWHRGCFSGPDEDDFFDADDDEFFFGGGGGETPPLDSGGGPKSDIIRGRKMFRGDRSGRKRSNSVPARCTGGGGRGGGAAPSLAQTRGGVGDRGVGSAARRHAYQAKKGGKTDGSLQETIGGGAPSEISFGSTTHTALSAVTSSMVSIDNGSTSFGTYPVSGASRGNSAESGMRSATPSTATATTGGRKLKSDGKEYRVKPTSAYPGKTYLTVRELHDEMLRESVVFHPLTSGMAHSTSSSNAVAVVPTRKQQQQHHPSSDVIRAFGPNFADGRIGTLRVEILGCVGLSKSKKGRKPDTIAYVICGDAAFVTDIIPSCLSPMWPCKSRRAALVPIFHAYARLFVGVFDVVTKGSTKKKVKENDEFLGRVVVDLSCLRPDVEYDSTLPLRASSFVYDRRRRGAVRVRLGLHWYNARGAVMSYLHRPRRRKMEAGADASEVEYPTVLCGDAKTYRNVAVTVHGKDLPGRYTRKAFRATMREAALYHKQTRFLMYHLANDAMTYERPLLSLYLFCGWMHCVYLGTVKFVPPYFIGYLIVLYVHSYAMFILNESYHLGYSPLTVPEVFRALARGGGGGTDFFVAGEEGVVLEEGTNDDVVDHMEFPFSERNMYHKLTVEESLWVPTKTKKDSSSGDKREKNAAVALPPMTEAKGNTVPESSSHMPNSSSDVPTLPLGGSIEEDDWVCSDNENDDNSDDYERGNEDNESTPSDVDEDVDEDSDFVESDEEEEGEGSNASAVVMSEQAPSAIIDQQQQSAEDGVGGGGGSHAPCSSSAGAFFSSAPSPPTAQRRRSIPSSPQQNVDILPKKRVPFKTHLSRLEGRCHKWTGHLFDDHVSPPPLTLEENGEVAEGMPSVDGDDQQQLQHQHRGISPDLQTEQQQQQHSRQDVNQQNKKRSKKHKKKKKKPPLDEFDKRLGLKPRASSNPVLALTASYLGPVMGMVRIYVTAIRISFNIGTWRDPYLSFWVLVLLLTLMGISIIFPWRIFLGLMGIVFVGPQNMILKSITTDNKRGKTDSSTQPEATDDSVAIPDSPSMEADGSTDPLLAKTERRPGKNESKERSGRRGMRLPRMYRRGKKGADNNSEDGASNLNDTSTERDKMTSSPEKQPPPQSKPEPRIAFTAQPSKKISQKSSKKNIASSNAPAGRDVIVPYSRLRKERFYYWPPDPSVSTAKPMFGRQQQQQQKRQQQQLREKTFSREETPMITNPSTDGKEAT